MVVINIKLRDNIIRIILEIFQAFSISDFLKDLKS